MIAATVLRMWKKMWKKMWKNEVSIERGSGSQTAEQGYSQGRCPKKERDGQANRHRTTQGLPEADGCDDERREQEEVEGPRRLRFRCNRVHKDKDGEDCSAPRRRRTMPPDSASPSRGSFIQSPFRQSFATTHRNPGA